MKRLLIALICSLFFVIAWCGVQDIPSVATEGEEDCVCRIMVECYYPGYKPGIDLPFASKIVYSCAEAEEYMQHISQPAFFFLYPANSKNTEKGGELE